MSPPPPSFTTSSWAVFIHVTLIPGLFFNLIQKYFSFQSVMNKFMHQCGSNMPQKSPVFSLGFFMGWIPDDTFPAPPLVQLRRCSCDFSICKS